MTATTGGPGNDADTDEMDEEDGTENPPETSGTTTDGDTDEPMPGTEHALGTIVLGETHPVGTGDALAILSAAFVPDASIAPQSCAMDVDGCMVSPPLDCAPTVCGADQVCAYDDNCVPTC